MGLQKFVLAFSKENLAAHVGSQGYRVNQPYIKMGIFQGLVSELRGVPIENWVGVFKHFWNCHPENCGNDPI